MTLDLPPWPDDFPADQIRREVAAMGDAWVDALTVVLPADAIRGLYLKGSANRPWDSAIDYVPERSDIDIHVDVRSADDERRFDELTFALEVAAHVDRAYRARVPEPLHRPKPQLTFISTLHALPDYLPSPASTVRTLIGKPYAATELNDAQRAAQRERDRVNLLAHGEFLAALSRRAVDRPGGLLANLLPELAWRVSPVAPRVLSLAGEAYEDAWSMNRTALVRRLERSGHHELAEAYVAHYAAGWRLFRANRRGDHDAHALAARDALSAGASVIRLGMEAAAVAGPSA